MSNSSLAVYTKLSPNCTKPRNAKIDTITIHCMAGNCSIETCGEIFAPTSRQASSNYGIGSDGRVGLYVDEANRSWCTSSSSNDNRAVTIEVANTVAADPWPVSDKAYAALLDLVTDICQRNGIKKLLWQGDKSLIGQVAKQNMSVHRWFAAKACPGDYLYNRHGAIADEVNKRLGAASTSTTTTTTTNTSATTTTTSSDETIWNTLKGKGLNDFAVAGLMGNLYAESGLKSNNLQNTYETKLGYTDATYTAAVDNGKYTNFVKDCAGYGLAQWTYYTRKQSLLDFAKAACASIGDLAMQLNFLWTELQGYSAVMKILNCATSVRQASDIVLTQYERPADQSEAVQVKRASYGQTYYDKYAGKTSTTVTPVTATTFTPYTVRVTANELYIRKGPGTGYGTNGSIKDKGVYTIVEESTGTGATKWGKLKSGAGWISLDYTKKL